MGCAVFLADVMEYNLPSCPERYARIAGALGVDGRGLGTEELGRAGINAVRRLVRDAGNPRLQELEFREKDVPRLVDYVLQDTFHLGLNPAPITAADSERILWTTLRA